MNILHKTCKFLGVSILAMLLVSGCAHTRKWKTSEKVAAGIFISSMILDGYTSHKMLQNPNNHETNFILGDHPSDKKIGIYFGTTTLLYLAALDQWVDDHEWRMIWLMGGSLLECGVSWRNNQLYHQGLEKRDNYE